MKPINWPDMSQSLSDALGLKGRVVLALDETTFPAVVAASLTNTPFDRLATPGGFTRESAAAGVGTNSGVLCQPAANTILVVRAIRITNETGATAPYTVRWLSAANVAAVTIVATTTLNAYNPRQQVAAGQQLGSTQSSFNHTAIVSGYTLDRIPVATDTSVYLELPGGFALYGNNPQAGALAVYNQTANAACRAQMFVDEYKLPG